MLAGAHRIPAVTLLLALPGLTGCLRSVVWYGKSPDRRHLAEILEDPGGQWVRLDGRDGRRYRGIGVESLVYGGGGRRLAYAAERKAGWVVITREAEGASGGAPALETSPEGPAWEGVGEIVWSAEGRRLAYAAERAGKWRVIVDGHAGGSFDALVGRSLQWSADGRRFAYVGRRGAARFVVEGARQSEGYDGIAGLTFSADGAQLGYVARSGASVRLWINGVPGRAHAAITAFALSPRGRRAAYIALDQGPPAAGQGPWFTVVDGVPGPGYDRIRSLVFDEAGAHLAYVARRGAAERVVLDEVEGEAFGGIAPESLAFSPEGKHLAYVARAGGRARVVFDGVPGPWYDAVEGLTFAPQGERWAYVARRGARSLVVEEGREGREEDGIGALVYRPDGQGLGYLARRGEQGLVVHAPARSALDGAVEGSLVFSRDSQHWACLVHPRGVGSLYIAIDGVPRIPFDVEELTAAVARAPLRERLAAVPSGLIPRWISAELELYLRRR